MTLRGRLLGGLAVLALAALGPAMAPSGGQAADGPHTRVTLIVDNAMISTSFTPKQALARAQQYAKFHLRVPRSVPRGVVLQGITVTSFGGNLAFATVSLDYAGPGSRAFSLSETKMHVSTNNGRGSRTWPVRIGKTRGTLIETTSTTVHAFDLSWFTTTGYDLRTLGTRTHLTRAEILRVAASV